MNVAMDRGESKTWVADPEQLTHWQGRLVSFCNDISDQLLQIHEDLKQNDQSLKLFTRENATSEPTALVLRCQSDVVDQRNACGLDPAV